MAARWEEDAWGSGMGANDMTLAGTKTHTRQHGCVLTAPKSFCGTLASRVLRTLGGTPNRDPCSLWGLIWGVPRDIGAL